MAINLDELRARIDYARSKWPTWDSTPTENPEVVLAELRATANQAGIPVAPHRRVISNQNWVIDLLYDWCEDEQERRDAWQRFREQIDAVAFQLESAIQTSLDSETEQSFKDVKLWANDIIEDRRLAAEGHVTRSSQRKELHQRVGQRKRDNPKKFARAEMLADQMSKNQMSQ